MSILIYGAGAVAFLAGVLMVGFGIPINEFSFGNTLIVAGTTAAVGGLIVLALGAAVSHLQRIAEALATRAPGRPGRPVNALEPAGAQARIPFPPKPKTEAAARDTAFLEPRAEAPAAVPFKGHQPEFLAPTLPNPDEPPVTVEDDVSLSPQPPAAAAPAIDEQPQRMPPFAARREMPAHEDDERDEPPKLDDGRRAPPSPPKPHSTYFDTMWPAEPKAFEPKPADINPAEPRSFESRPFEPKPFESKPMEPRFEESKAADFRAPAPKWLSPLPADDEDRVPDFRQKDVEPQPPEEEPRTVAILKSGVVDGMGYTLYVDGSIEAELPQGTLRFASINELRSHLEKTS